MCQSRILKGSTEQVYELVFAKALESYYEIKKNNNQVKFDDKKNISSNQTFSFLFSIVI